ncbi:PTS sugar transporter subunit IIB [Brachyspira sp. SAP_772]|uniref:PTS sugar transporter subunit IIB n=1 Tax=Brachyspira sp. SAP_772 TaxID=2608385 RepID=UPI0012F4E008|nr:PTS sugar transporter subunit IIB [Brachyspira sp. SAP_772]
MLKVLAVCANGSGTSLMMVEKIKKVLESFNIKYAQIEHSDLQNNKIDEYNLIFCPFAFLERVKEAVKGDAKIIGIKNILSEEEFKKQIIDSGNLEELKKL